MKFGTLFLFAAVLAVPLGTIAALPVASTEIEMVDSVEDLVSILESDQAQYQACSPPSSSVYVAVKETPLSIDWAGFDKKFTKYMTATMDEYGLPRYHLLLWEDVATRDRVIALASTGYELARVPAPKEYRPEAFYLNLLSSGGIYSEAMRWIFDPAHTATEVVCIPKTLYPAYEEYEAQRVAQEELESFMIPLAMMSGGTVTNLQVAIGSTTNGTVEIEVAWPTTTFTNRVCLFSCEDLVAGNWSVLVDRLPTYGIADLVFEDVAASNLTVRFYRAGDADLDSDGDFLPDSFEQVVSRSLTNNAHSDGGQVPDGYEVAMGLDPNDAADDVAALAAYLAAAGDPDGDSAPDWVETREGTNPHDRFD